MIHAKKAARKGSTADKYAAYLERYVHKEAYKTASKIMRLHKVLIKNLIQVKEEIKKLEEELELMTEPKSANPEIEQRAKSRCAVEKKRIQDALNEVKSKYVRLSSKLASILHNAEAYVNKVRAKAVSEHSKFVMFFSEKNVTIAEIRGDSSTICFAPLYCLIEKEA